MLDNITHMPEIRAFPMVWGGRGCGTGLELKIFLLKEFLSYLQNPATKHCHCCCQFAWAGGDKVLWHHLSVGLEKALSKGLRGSLGWRGWLELLVLSVLEAKGGNCLRKQLGQMTFHNCVLSKTGVNSVSEAFVLPLPCAK